MDYSKRLMKILTDDGLIERYNIMHSSFKFEMVDNKHKVSIDLIKGHPIIESDLFETSEGAKNDCARISILVINEIEFNIQNSFIEKLKTFINMLKFKLKENWENIYYKIFLNLSILYLTLGVLLLVSPIWLYLQGYILGGSSGNRVLIQRVEHGNIFYEKNDYLYVGDLFLIKDIATSGGSESSDYFEAQLTKNVVIFLASDDNSNSSYPTYILPRLMGVYIRELNKGEFVIVVLSYERDGLPKRYVSKNVSESAFNRKINKTKYNVISRYGSHVYREKYISKINGTSFYWGVLCIYKDYIITFLTDTFTNKYQEVDRVVGFNKFQKVTNYSITEY